MDYPAQYGTVNTAPGRWEHVLCNGIVLLSRGRERLVVSVRVRPDDAGAVVLSSHSDSDMASQYAVSIRRVMHDENPYRGQKVQFGVTLSFLDVPHKGWEDLILAPGIKEEVVEHSVSFLQRADALAEYGIAPRRGLLLAGRPGTGKTLICKVLMNESPGITCIAAHSSGLTLPRHIEELYDLARDTSPSIVFLEDLEPIGQGGGRNPAIRAGRLWRNYCSSSTAWRNVGTWSPSPRRTGWISSTPRSRIGRHGSTGWWHSSLPPMRSASPTSTTSHDASRFQRTCVRGWPSKTRD